MNVATAPAEPEIDPSDVADGLRASAARTGTAIDVAVFADGNAVLFGVKRMEKFTCRIAVLPEVCPEAFCTKTRFDWIFANDCVIDCSSAAYPVYLFGSNRFMNERTCSVS